MKIIIYDTETGLIKGILSGVSEDAMTENFKKTIIQIEDLPDTVENVHLNYKVVDGRLEKHMNCNPKFLINLQEAAKQKLRVDRASILADLDVKFMRALELGQDTADIVKQKQILRDITKSVDIVTTFKQFKEIKITDKLV